MNGPQATARSQNKNSPGPRARRVKFRSTDKTNISKFGVGLTTMSSMASMTASRAAAAEARHGLRHEATDTAIAELKGAAAAATRLKAEPSALLLCVRVCHMQHRVLLEQLLG